MKRWSFEGGAEVPAPRGDAQDRETEARAAAELGNLVRINRTTRDNARGYAPVL